MIHFYLLLYIGAASNPKFWWTMVLSSSAQRDVTGCVLVVWNGQFMGNAMGEISLLMRFLSSSSIASPESVAVWFCGQQHQRGIRGYHLLENRTKTEGATHTFSEHKITQWASTQI
jgi:hypothetical protein